MKAFSFASGPQLKTNTDTGLGSKGVDARSTREKSIIDINMQEPLDFLMDRIKYKGDLLCP